MKDIHGFEICQTWDKMPHLVDLLSILKIADIDLENNTMFGGLKTDAGRNRCVPIHPKIRDLIIKRVDQAKELESDYLFNDPDSQSGMRMTYDKYIIKLIVGHSIEDVTEKVYTHRNFRSIKRKNRTDTIIAKPREHIISRG